MKNKHKICFVVLAAGKGTRLQMTAPKVLAPLLGKKMFEFPLMAIRDFCDESSIYMVLGHEQEKVRQEVKANWDLSFCLQEEQLGTGHALQCFAKQIGEKMERFDYIAVLNADTPLLTADIFSKLFSALSDSGDLSGAFATFKASNPHGLGRVIRERGQVQIIEEKDLKEDQKLVTEVNSGLYLFKSEFLKKHLMLLSSDNAAREYYLTDLIGVSKEILPVLFSNEEFFLGVNDLGQLEEVRKILSMRKCSKLEKDGVMFYKKETNLIDWDVQVDKFCQIYPNVNIFGQSKIAAHSEIHSGCQVYHSEIGEGTILMPYTCVRNSFIGDQVSLGPFAHIRPGTQLENEVKIGNFVEVKKGHLKERVKVSHLSYVGDAEIGEETNIGCGFITCNYDGEKKHKTIIGKNTFIGSDTQVIAPIRIGNQSYIASGSTINKNIPDGTFAIARGKQINKENMAKKFLKNKK